MRNRLLITLLGFVLLGCSATQPSLADAQTSTPPNVIILYADDLGYGDLSCYNPESKIPTPNLDRLAASGAKFLDGHSSSGICTPSRYALLTGKHHWRDLYGIVKAFGKSVFKDEQLTLPEMMQANGYHTACIGKWHLGWDWDAIRLKKGNGPDAFDWSKPIPDGPLAHGFDHYFGDTVINFPPYTWIEDDKVAQVPDTKMSTKKWPKIKEGRWEARPGPMVTGWNPYDALPTLGDKAVSYIASRKEKDEPFFLYFAYPSPHAPIIPNDAFDGKSDAGPYGDLVVESDHIAGRILDALEKAGLDDNTIVVFSADNGPERYAYARDETFGHWSSHPLRGLKRDIYEGGHRVPFIMRWPGVIEPGSTKDALVSQIDLYATLASRLGFTLPDHAAVDSHDMMPYLLGQSDVVRESHVHNTKEEKFAFRHGDWLLINTKTGIGMRKDMGNWEQRHNYAPDDKGPVELYNLSNDLSQHKNIADQHPETVSAMQALLEKAMEDGRTRPSGSE